MGLSQDGPAGAGRPAKRGRAAVLGDDSDEEGPAKKEEGPAKKEEGPAKKEKGDASSEGQGPVEHQQQKQPDANGVKVEVDGAAGGGGSSAAVKREGDGGALAGSGHDRGRKIRPVGPWARNMCGVGALPQPKRCPSNSCGPCPNARHHEHMLFVSVSTKYAMTSCAAVSALCAPRLDPFPSYSVFRMPPWSALTPALSSLLLAHTQEVLRALHSHLLPLLELQLGAPLDALAPHQLHLLPPLPACVLQAPTPAAAAGGDSKAGEEAMGAAQSAKGAEGWAVLPGGVGAMCEALAAGLEDVRMGVVVTAVAATAAGVRVTCKSGGAGWAGAGRGEA